MKKIRKAAVAVGVAGALSVGALVAVPALAGSDDAVVDRPARYSQTTDESDDAVPNPYCTGDQARDRDQLRIHMMDRGCVGAQPHDQQGPRQQGPGRGLGPGVGDCPFAPDSE